MISSPLARIIRLFNVLIAVALAAGVALVYWYAWRPLAQTSGSVDAPVSAPVSVAFDALGEPHIRAAALEDALFAQGYVTAQDRLFQMDGLRRFAAGDLAEVLGPALLESDRESRRQRMRRIAEAAYATMPAEDRAALGAYARGVSYYIATHLDRLPLEFSLLRYQPLPWSAVDCILVGLDMFRDLTTTWRDDLMKAHMLAGSDPRKIEFLFPARIGRVPAPGSNAWAVAGSRTASGRPLLSNDMHLEYAVPGIWYMTALQAPGLDVAGVALPGLPGVIVGHNQRIAWGITNLQFDVQDLYIENFDEKTGRYQFRGHEEQARAEREIIRVKGAPATELVVWVTRHGPLFLSEGNQRMALRWTAAEPGIFAIPFVAIDQAGNWQQFTQALARMPGPGQNFVYADVDGNIGYHAAGKLPIRHGFSGDLPVDGSSGNFEWDGFIPFEQLPSAYNPPSGLVASSNQNPFPKDYPYPVYGNFAPPYRAQQVRDLLSARKGLRAEDMLAIQTDVYSAFHKFLASQIVGAYENRGAHNPALDRAITLLRSWNGQMNREMAAPFLVTLIFQHLRTAVAETAAPGRGLGYDLPMSSAVIEKLLRERPAGWFNDYNALLLSALADAVEEGRRMQGDAVNRWKYGAYLKVEIDNPVLHRIPLVGKYFDIARVPMSGSQTTVKQTTERLAPSMRMNADLGNWERSLMNLPIGQSGQALSSHYKDQWTHYYNGESYPMQFGKVQAKSSLVFRPIDTEQASR